MSDSEVRAKLEEIVTVSRSALEGALRLVRELEAAREVCEAAGHYLNERGNVQARTPLHDALAAYYRTLNELATAKPEEPTT
jgi:hypothetical protein